MISSWLSNQEYYYIYSMVPRCCVDLWIENINDQILLVMRDIEPQEGKWHFSGGRVQFGESIFDACKRIAKKETGLNIKEIFLKGYMEFNTEKQNNTDMHTISLVFNCDFTGSIKDNCDWFSKKDIKKFRNNIHTIHYNYISTNWSNK
jgi:ADP-ribose pyrophosphatase YjhB (NUDIX family)